MNNHSFIEQILSSSEKSPLKLIDFLEDIFKNSSTGIIITKDNGDLIYATQEVTNFCHNKFNNISEIAYIFDFDICILDKNIDIMTFSPFSVCLASKIRTTVECKCTTKSATVTDITIISNYLEGMGYYFILLPQKAPQCSEAFEELAKTNKKLLEKINENEQLRSHAQSQAIRESLVNSISNAIRNSLEIDSILQTAVEEIGKALGTDTTFFVKYIPNEVELPVTKKYIANENYENLEELVNINDDFILQQLLETKEPATGLYTKTGDENNSKKFKLIVPVVHMEEFFGMLFLIRKSRKWHSEEISFVQSIADQISISIKNGQLFEDTTSKNIKISVLNEILKSINSSLILDDVFYTIGREIKRLIDFDKASIAILDDTSRQVKLFAKIQQDGLVDILRSGPHIAKGTAISWAIENIKPILINLDDNREFSDTLTLKISGIKTAIIIPMINKGKVTGIFYIGSAKENSYTESEVEIMSQIAGQIAIAVENAKLYWQTETQATKEMLINQIVSSTRKSLKLSDVLQTTVKELSLLLSVNYCFFYYLLSDTPEKSFYEYNMSSSDSLMNMFLLIMNNEDAIFKIDSSGIINWKLSDHSLSPKNRSLLLEYKIKSLLIIPINYNDPMTNKDTEIGLLGLANSEYERDWKNDDISLLKVISDQIMITINQARLLEQTQTQKSQLEKTLLQLKEAQTQLIQSEKMAALGQLVAGVAHEINTPIGSITSNNNIFSKCTEKIKFANAEEPVNSVKINQLLTVLSDTIKINNIACERISDIVRSLKNFARLDESELKEVDIHEGIDSTLSLLRHETRGKIYIVKEYSKLPLIECYPNLLNQVFMNLLVNAYHSIPEKGQITIKTKQVYDKIHVSITDSGIGISENNLKKIFDPGFTTKGVGVGTGLGLSICYQIIEKHKGQITVESKEGVGTTFTVILSKKLEM